MIEGILIESFIYGIMALGVFITFRILDFPDMTVDGSFPMGAVIVASMVVGGFHFSTALFVAFIGGLLAGSVTALIHIKLKVHNLLAGILTLTMLYSINIRILGNKSNQALLNKDTVITWVDGLIKNLPHPQMMEVLFFFIVVMVVKSLLDLFFRTDMGLAMISMGDNPKMVTTLGINGSVMKIIGVSIANGLVAVSGGFAAMYLGFGDINLGQGIIVSGLASVMIGEFIIRKDTMFFQTFRVILGCTIYKAVMYVGRIYGEPNDLKLWTGLLLIACLAFTKFPILKKRAKA
ncbi:MAG: ABC transporter permease [Deferribacteraceae bacterium]|jgi:putative ABC transport system permease protein|nr:ABC transporter permease [Deferribacteraceae bacterium]